MTPPARPRVAIACQGGGSHTAFTAGVLERLLQPERLEEYDVVGLSGTSGGAVCATLAWVALVEGDPARAGRLRGLRTELRHGAPQRRATFDRPRRSPPTRSSFRPPDPSAPCTCGAYATPADHDGRRVRATARGNLSLHQELHFIEKIDELLEESVIAPGGRYKPIMVRVIELSRSRLSASLGPASKLNRDPAFIGELIEHGAERADEFLAALSFERAWRAGDADAVLAHFADDAELSAPGADGDVAAFVRGRLADG